LEAFMTGNHPSQHIYRMIGKLSSRGVDVDDDHVRDRGGRAGTHAASRAS
jgi:hypothetical protein